MPKKQEAKSEARVVEATGAAAQSGGYGNEIEQAMVEATVQAQAEGVTDPDEIRDRKLAARKAVKNARAKASQSGDDE